MYIYDKDEIKENLDIEEVRELVEFLGGYPKDINNDFFVSQTICHNNIGEGSYKLYYYDNTKLFNCYSGCSSSFDIFELVSKVKEIELNAAIQFVANFFGIVGSFDTETDNNISDYLKDFKRYDKIKKQEEKRVEMKIYKQDILSRLPQVRFLNWEQEGISFSAIKEFGIKYESNQCRIIIPHYNIDNELIGIRQRTLIEEYEKYGKYLPLQIGKTMYRHMLGFSLYGINKNAGNIKREKHAIIVESEKAVLQAESYFGRDKNIVVAVCGSSFSAHQFNILLSLGVKHITICFDKAGSNDPKEIQQYVKKFYNMYNKFHTLVDIDFMYDKDNKYLGLKENPLDKGKDIFLRMYKERIKI